MTLKPNVGPYEREAEENNKLLRLDKNVANSIDQIIDLSKAFGQSVAPDMKTEDKNMINNIIFYMCHARQGNLYGFGSIIPKDLAAFIGVTEGYLRRKHPNPVQLRGKSEEEIKQLYALQEQDPTQRVYDSILENALYTLNHVPLNLRSSSKELIQEGDRVKYTLLSESYLLLERLETVIIKSKKGEPRVNYNYTLHEKFVRNLSLYFMRFNIQGVIKLRRSGLSELYLYLKNLKDTFREKKKSKEHYERRLNFNQICALAGVPRYTREGQEYKNPRIIKQRLIAAFDRILVETDLVFTVQWGKDKDTSKGKYVPCIYFDDVEKFEPSQGREIYDNAVIHRERRLIFKQNLIHELIKYYKYHNVNRDNMEIRVLEWVKSSRDMDSKVLAFRNAQFESYGMVHPKINEIVEDWKALIRNINSMDEIITQLHIASE